MPSVGVDLVFNINSVAPYSRSSIVYDINPGEKTVTIAQPNTPLTPSTVYDELHISTIIQTKNRIIRVGLKCTAVAFISDYRLANNKKINALRITFAPPAKEINIRSAFRLPLNSKFVIKGKILHDHLEYFTPSDFSIRDISLSGIGLILPKKRKTFPNPLGALELDEQVGIGIILINTNLAKPLGTIPIKAQVTRIIKDYSDTHMLIGLHILTIKPEGEDLLNKFIHDAQIAELKRLSGRGL